MVARIYITLGGQEGRDARDAVEPDGLVEGEGSDVGSGLG